jgi:hypothetical protein
MAFKSTTSGTTYANAAAMKAAQVEGGTIAQGGNLDITDATGEPTRPVKNQVLLADMNAADDSIPENLGSRVLANDGDTGSTTDRVGIAKAVSGGTLAYNAGSTEWIMSGNNVTTTIGGVANTVLASASSDAGVDRGTENIKIDDRKLGLAASGDINVLAAPSSEIHSERTKSADAGDRLTFVNSDDGTDAVSSEIASSRSVPGKLTYRFGGAAPKKDVYKASDEKES